MTPKQASVLDELIRETNELESRYTTPDEKLIERRVREFLSRSQNRILDDSILWWNASSVGLYASLTNREFANLLGLSSEQRRSVNRVVTDLRNKVSERVFEAEDALRKRRFAVLSTEQANAIRKLMGQSIHWRVVHQFR